MELIKESVKNLKGYKPSNLPFRIKLDANEGKNMVFGDGYSFEGSLNLNFYPDSDARLLREELEKYIGVEASKIVVGNGSSEMIDLIMKAFIDKGDGVLSFVPSFSMYLVYTQIYSGKFIGVESNKDFSLDISKLINKAKYEKPKIIFLCNPNNPTGYKIPIIDIKRVLEETEALVVVDEAYMEFSQGSMIDEIDNYNNLVILRTLSKGFGLAGLRLGYMISNENIIEIINRVKPPYNVNALTQYVATKALQKKDKIKDYIEDIKNEREKLYEELKTMDFLVYKSQGNFLLFSSDIYNFFNKLADKGILIRRFSGDLEKYYRVTVGSKEENKAFIDAVKEIMANEKG